MGFLQRLFKLKVSPIDIGVPPNTVAPPENTHTDPFTSSEPLAGAAGPGRDEQHFPPPPCPDCGAKPRFVQRDGRAAFELPHAKDCPRSSSG